MAYTDQHVSVEQQLEVLGLDIMSVVVRKKHFEETALSHGNRP